MVFLLMPEIQSMNAWLFYTFHHRTAFTSKVPIKEAFDDPNK